MKEREDETVVGKCDREAAAGFFPEFELIEPATLGQACAFLSENRAETKVMAGGTDLLVKMKHRLLSTKYLLNLKTIPGMKYIVRDPTGDLRIGALTTLEEIERSPVVREGWPVLADAACRVAALQHRTRATLGGNICLDTRCLYYNQALTRRLSRAFCFKMGGDCCHVVKGGKKCFAVFSADTVPVLSALKGKVKIISPGGERVQPIDALYTGDGRSAIQLGAGEILSEVIIPALPRRSGAAYVKYALRSSLDFPLVGVAAFVSAGEKDNSCSEVKIVFTGVSSRPVEALKTGMASAGETMADALIATASKSAAKEIKVISHSYCSADYRKRIMEVCTGRALSAAWQSLKEGYPL